MRLRPALLVLALLAAVGSTRPVMAAAPTESEGVRVVLVTNHADAAVMPLLKAELEALGLEVVTVDKGEDEVVPRDLGIAAREQGAVAGFRVIVGKGTVEVWVFDRITGKVTLREVLTQSEGSKTATTTVVLRAVELLRVSLMELEAPHAPRGDVAPPENIEKLAGFPDNKGLFGLELGAGVLFTSTDYAASPTLQVAARYRAFSWLDLSAFASPSIVSSTVEGPEGTGTVAPKLFGAHARWVPADSLALVQPSFGVGGGLLWVSMLGDAVPGRAEFTEQRFSAVALARAALSLRPTNNFRVWLGLDGGFVFAPTTITFGRRTVSEGAPVLLQGAAGFELAVP